jgi:hypothetical protein
MKFALVLLILFPDGTAQEVPWAETNDERMCIIAGRGSALIMSQANPGIIVGFRCDVLAEAGV